MRFSVTLHEAPAILEIVYPAGFTAEDLEAYAVESRETMDRIRGPWACLVDARDVSALGPELLDQVARLNAYALEHGMRASARLISTRPGALEGARSARGATGYAVTIKTFTDRDPALAWLRTQLARAR